MIVMIVLILVMWHLIRVQQRSVVAMRALGDAPVEAGSKARSMHVQAHS